MAKNPALRAVSGGSAKAANRGGAHKVLEAYGARQQKTSYTGENSWEP